MNMIQNYKNEFGAIADKVHAICDTKKNRQFYEPSVYYATPDNYSDYGFKSLGTAIGFPAPFVKELNASEPRLARRVIMNRMDNHFLFNPKPLTARSFTVNDEEKIYGIVSDSYAYFDDDEVMNIIEDSPLASLAFKNVNISPERLHLRAVEDTPFFLPGDSSPMYFSYFIDNSMVGASSFRIMLGIYRQVCQNGLIVSMKQLTLCKQIHKGTKDIAAEFNSSLQFLAEKKDDVRKILLSASTEKSVLEDMAEDFKQDYLAKKLTMSKKEADKVISLYDAYSNEYGSRSRWALANAITEYARDIKDIQRREFLEGRALLVA